MLDPMERTPLGAGGGHRGPVRQSPNANDGYRSGWAYRYHGTGHFYRYHGTGHFYRDLRM